MAVLSTTLRTMHPVKINPGRFEMHPAEREPMHDQHKSRGHYPHHGHEQHGGSEDLRKLQVMLDHWIEHSDSHVEGYREWAGRASAAGEEEIAREVHLAIDKSGTVKDHLKRAKAILAAKLVLRK